jgi:hypothetical protein
MKKSRFAEEKIIAILKELDAGAHRKDLQTDCRLPLRNPRHLAYRT